MKPEDLADPPTLPAPSASDPREPDTLVAGGLDARIARQGMIVAEDPTNAFGAYVFGEALGRGGMGEVMLAHDRRIGRDVAVKRLRSGAPTQDEISRFLREARIQARLDHPAIVPVYELGRDQSGRPYFTMKRVAGTTLTEVLARRAATRQRLLRAFAEVCRAVDFAHSRGVVHRDLKPGNIVLGEYGEVCVLDWGAARVLGDVPGGIATADIDTLEGAAPPGQVLGTPGYMAPEQLQHPEVGRAADVYALGTILFELLAGEPLHARAQAIQSTMSRTTVTSPAARRPDRAIPPELDALCTAMLVFEPGLRPTARRCADSIDEFLDGDRDLERRRTMAIDLVWHARAAHDAGLRVDAMRTASRALALDPGADGAAELVTRLMLEPPHDLPPEARDELRRTEADGARRHARSAVPGYLLIAAFLPIIVWNGVLSWPVVLASTAMGLVMALGAWLLVREPDRSHGWMLLYAVGNALLLAVLSRISGSFTFVSALVCFITMSSITYPAFIRRPWGLIAIMLAGFLIPIALEGAGVIASTWSFVEGGMLLQSGAVRVHGVEAIVSILLATVATVVMAGLLSLKLARTNRDAQQRLVIQAWHLRQLLPAPAAPRAPAGAGGAGAPLLPPPPLMPAAAP
ncbi:MAG TPA: protein kinase [Kofleriaceae bacterium]|nr:protein kinase [Kofleriaceae bacterium]